MDRSASIDAYLAPFPGPIRSRLDAMRAAIREEAPQAEECISYGIPTFDVGGKHLVHFAGYAHHVGFYPGAEAAAHFVGEFEGFVHAKGSVQFPHEGALPLDLVRRIVRFRLEAVAKGRASGRSKRRASGPATAPPT